MLQAHLRMESSTLTGIARRLAFTLIMRMTVIEPWSVTRFTAGHPLVFDFLPRVNGSAPQWDVAEAE